MCALLVAYFQSKKNTHTHTKSKDDEVEEEKMKKKEIKCFPFKFWDFCEQH